MKICYDQGCNDIGVVIATKWCLYLFTFSSISQHWEPFFQNRLREPFPSIATSMFVKFRRNLWERYRDILEWSFMVIDTAKNGQSWCSAVIIRQQSGFDMQFHLIVVSIFLKTCVKDHGDSSSWLLERRIWLVCIQVLLLAFCKHFGVL